MLIRARLVGAITRCYNRRWARSVAIEGVFHGFRKFAIEF